MSALNNCKVGWCYESPDFVGLILRVDKITKGGFITMTCIDKGNCDEWYTGEVYRRRLMTPEFRGWKIHPPKAKLAQDFYDRIK